MNLHGVTSICLSLYYLKLFSEETLTQNSYCFHNINIKINAVTFLLEDDGKVFLEAATEVTFVELYFQTSKAL